MINMPDVEPEHDVSPTAHLLDEIAQRVGPSVDAIFGEHPPLPEVLISHFNSRAQYLGAPEQESRIPEIDRAMKEDLWRAKAFA